MRDTMATKLYDQEFDPDLLRVLKERDILARANPVQGVPLTYNLFQRVAEIEQLFQQERKANPLLETTPPEAWLAAKSIPDIQRIRRNVDLDEVILGQAVQLHFAPRPAKRSVSQEPNEGALVTTVEPYRERLRQLYLDLYDRRKSLRGILVLGRGLYTVRGMGRPRQPTSLREAIIKQGIEKGWKNHEIARELDKQGLTPRKGSHSTSYGDMLKNQNQLFYSMKSAIKKKYQAP